MNYRTQVFDGFTRMDAERWRSLWAASPQPTPFTQIEFLSAMERSESACAESGWAPLPLLVHDESGAAVAAVPLYAKSHSYGEYVFDWAWARAFEQAGLRYYPKGLVASPFSPVPGSRLLGRDPQARSAAAHALTDFVQSSGLSSMHLLFGTHEDHDALEALGWLRRTGVQFHWMNKGYDSFEDFLNALAQPKRKKIRAERRKVQEAGVRCEVRWGSDITPAHWAFFYRCYCQTYLEHGNPPYLSEAFFDEVRQTMPQSFVMILARDDTDALIACALLLIDAKHEVLYGRYWGSIARVPCLHFELAYYGPIEWAISRGIQRFEGGAQGEHKMARGFEPIETASMHWIEQPQFREAVANFLEREGQGMSGYLSELDDRTPFRAQETQKDAAR